MRERRRGCRTPGRVGSPRLQTPRPAPAPQPAGYSRPCTCTPGPWLHPIRLGLRAPFWGGGAGCRAGGVSAPGSRKPTPAPSPQEPQPCPCHGSPEDGKAPDKVSTPARPQLRPASSSAGKGPSGRHWAGSSGGLLQAGQGRSLRPRGSDPRPPFPSHAPTSRGRHVAPPQSCAESTE